jgi:hypothetical protein
MAGDDGTVRGRQDRVDEAELPDAIGKLLDLRSRMSAGVMRIGLQLIHGVGCDLPDN